MGWGRQEELETEAMRAGTAHHARLEAETTVEAWVEVASWEEFWAVRLLNSVAGLRQLAAEGLTREVYVFGLVQVDPHVPAPLMMATPGQ